MGWFGEYISRFWSLGKVDYMTTGCFWTHIENIMDLEASKRVTTWLQSVLESVCPDFEVLAKLTTWLRAENECILWILWCFGKGDYVTTGWLGERLSRFWCLGKVDFMTTGCFWTHIVNITDLEASKRVTTWLRSVLESMRPYLESSGKVTIWLRAENERI